MASNPTDPPEPQKPVPPDPPKLDDILQELAASTPDLLAGLEPSELDRLLAAELSQEDELGEFARRFAQGEADRLDSLLLSALSPLEAEPEEPLPRPDPDLTAVDVAKWMQQQVETHGMLFQESAVYHISRHFGTQFSEVNPNGNPAIAKIVLREFRRPNEKTVVWVWQERYWRERQPGDPPRRRVA